MSKKSRKEGARVANFIKNNNTENYITDVDLNNNFIDVIHCKDFIVKATKDEKSFMLISASNKVLIIVSYVPDKFSKNISHHEWLDEATLGLISIKTDVSTNNTLSIIRLDKPDKYINQIKHNGNEFLGKNNKL